MHGPPRECHAPARTQYPNSWQKKKRHFKLYNCRPQLYSIQQSKTNEISTLSTKIVILQVSKRVQHILPYHVWEVLAGEVAQLEGMDLFIQDLVVDNQVDLRCMSWRNVACLASPEQSVYKRPHPNISTRVTCAHIVQRDVLRERTYLVVEHEAPDQRHGLLAVTGGSKCGAGITQGTKAFSSHLTTRRVCAARSYPCAMSAGRISSAPN
jgi:hypothetical protein